MKIAFQILIIFLTFSACSYSNNNADRKESKISHSDSEIVQNIILSFKVRELAECNRFDDSTIGYSSQTSSQFLNYKWLLLNATTNQLVDMTNHKNTVVKAYAIRALNSRDYGGLKQIFKHQYKDSSTFTHQSGCIGISTYYNAFFYGLIKTQLSDKEKKEASLYLHKTFFDHSY